MVFKQTTNSNHINSNASVKSAIVYSMYKTILYTVLAVAPDTVVAGAFVTPLSDDAPKLAIFK